MRVVGVLSEIRILISVERKLFTKFVKEELERIHACFITKANEILKQSVYW